jgi:hypothetical protein
MNKIPLYVLLGLAAAAPALAHEGHGLPGSAHWHATDVFGWVVAAVAVAVAAWWIRRK